MDTDKGYRLYGYRWVILGVFMFINITIQILWISFAPIITPAAKFYGATDTQIGLLPITSWLVAYVVLSLPVSWAIDTYGFHITVGFGAVMMAVFGVLRGFAVSYPQVFWTTAGIAVAQPFLLNAWTKVAAHWFGTRHCRRVGYTCQFARRGNWRSRPAHPSERRYVHSDSAIDLWDHHRIFVPALHSSDTREPAHTCMSTWTR